MIPALTLALVLAGIVLSGVEQIAARGRSPGWWGVIALGVALLLWRLA